MPSDGAAPKSSSYIKFICNTINSIYVWGGENIFERRGAAELALYLALAIIGSGTSWVALRTLAIGAFA